MVNDNVIVFRESDIKLDGIEQLHSMDETIERVFRCLLIHPLQNSQLIVVLEAPSPKYALKSWTTLINVP